MDPRRRPGVPATDEPSVREPLSDFLTFLGNHAPGAAGRPEGLALFARGVDSLVLTDLSTPA